MNKQFGILCSIALMVLFLSGCGIRVINGSGNIATEEFTVSDFTAVNFTSAGEVTVVQGDSEGLTVETDDNLLPYLESSVSNGVLTIGTKDDTWIPILRPSESIRYVLEVKTVTALDLTGAGTIEAAELSADQLDLANSGAGAISIGQLTANELTVHLSGAGRVEVAGEANQQTVELSGLGNYEAGDLASQSASVTLSGAGQATVWASEELDAEISGVGTISYYGSPQLNAQTSGVGTVQQLGDK